MSSDIQTWYKQVPIFTRMWLTGTVGISLLARFGILPPQYLILQSVPLFQKLQVVSSWVLLCVVLLKLNSSTAMATNDGSILLSAQSGHRISLYAELLLPVQLLEAAGDGPLQAETRGLLLSAILQLDSVSVDRAADGFAGKVLRENSITHLTVGVSSQLLMDPMVLSVLYVWCKLNKDVIVNFWFGTRFKAMYLPWVLLGMNLILSSGYFITKHHPEAQILTSFNIAEAFSRSLASWSVTRTTSSSSSTHRSWAVRAYWRPLPSCKISLPYLQFFFNNLHLIHSASATSRT